MAERQLTNNELEERLVERLTAMFKDHQTSFTQHALDDLTNFGKINERMDTLATKEDIKEIKKLYKTWLSVIANLSRYRKFTYKSIMALAGFLVAIAAIIQSVRLILKI